MDKPIVYRTWLEVEVGKTDRGIPLRKVVVIYRGTSKARAVTAYNDIAANDDRDSVVVSYGWEVVE